MYEHIPKRTNNKAFIATFVLFAGAAAMFIFSVTFTEIKPMWPIQLAGVIMLIPAVMLVTRYITRSFMYKTEATDRGTDFTVTEIAGKRRTVVCRIALASITESRVVLRGKDEKKPKARIFDYRPDLLPDKSILIRSNEGGEDIYIFLAYDEALLSILPADKAEGEDE